MGEPSGRSIALVSKVDVPVTKPNLILVIVDVFDLEVEKVEEKRLNKSLNVFENLEDLQGDNALDSLLQSYGSGFEGENAKEKGEGRVEDELKGVESEKTTVILSIVVFDISSKCCYKFLFHKAN